MNRVVQRVCLGVGVGLIVGPLIALAQEAARGKTDQEGAVSASGTYKVDPIHTSNVFRIRHLNVANFYGRFNEVEGRFVLADDVARCSIEVTIPTASVDTNHPDRDKHLRAAELFDVENHPRMTFRSTSVKAAGPKGLEVAGDLTLRGVTRPITVMVERTGAGPGLRGEFRAGLETTFTIKRSDFGMTALMPTLGDEVQFTIAVEGIREP